MIGIGLGHRNGHLISSLAAAMVLAALTFVASPGVAADFRVTSPLNWKRLQTESEDDTQTEMSLYINSQSHSHETVATQSFPISNRVPFSLAYFQLHADHLAELRFRVFSSVGISNYVILYIEVHPATGFGSPTYLLVHSRYTNAAAQDVQVLERQYFEQQKLFVVTYTSVGATTPEKTKSDMVFTYFSPNLIRSSRLPSSISETVGAAGKSLTKGTVSNYGKSEPPLLEPNLSDPSTRQLCEDIPIERRRSKEDASFENTVGTLFASPYSCFRGFIDNYVGLAKGVAKIGMDAIQIFNPMDSTYRNEVLATEGAIAGEIFWHPLEFGKKIAFGTWRLAAECIGHDWVCLKPSEQIRAVCDLVTNLLPINFVIKTATKSLQTAAEIANFSDKTKEILGLKIAGKKLNRSSVGEETSVAEVFSEAKVTDATPAQVTVLREAVNSSIKRTINVSGESLASHLANPAVRDSVELLWYPTNPLARGPWRNSGHVDLRIGDKIYSMEKRGIHVEDAAAVLAKEFKKNNPVFGYGFTVGDRERKMLIQYFENNKDLKYDFWKQNCSQTACLALRDAGIIKIPKGLTLDPLVTSRIIKRIKREGYSVVYSNALQKPSELTAGNLRFRAEAFSTIGIEHASPTAAAIAVNNLLIDADASATENEASQGK